MKLKSYLISAGMLGLGLAGLSSRPASAGHTPEMVNCESGQFCGWLVQPLPNQPNLLPSRYATKGVDAPPSAPESDPLVPAAMTVELPDRPDAELNDVDLKPEEVLTTAAALRSDYALPISANLAQVAAQPSAVETGPQGQTEAPNGADLPLDLDQLPGDPELGVIRVRNPLEDPELGILRIRQPPNGLDLPTPAPPKIAFLTARITAANSDNILLVVNDVGGLTGGTFFRPAVTLGIYPSLGPETVLIGTINVGLQRYNNQPTINYDDWRFRLGIRQGLSPRTYGQLNLSYQELFRPGSTPSRFFENKAIGLTLGRRDPLTPQLVLDSYYQIQLNDARSLSSPSSGSVVTDFSRLSQLVGFYLSYTISPQFETGLSYQLNLIDYTVQDRYDTVQQLLGQVVYNLTPRVQFSLYGGWSFGRSSDPRVRFDDTIFGFTIEATAPLF